MDKNGGTWPKARSGPVIEHGTGTILHPRKNKERLPLSVFLNNPPSWSSQSNPKTDTSSIDFSVRSIFLFYFKFKYILFLFIYYFYAICCIVLNLFIL